MVVVLVVVVGWGRDGCVLASKGQVQNLVGQKIQQCPKVLVGGLGRGRE